MNTQELQLGQEYIPANESELISTIRDISEQRVKRSQKWPVPRDQHPKQHGCVWAEFIVEDNLPENIRVGVFKEPKTYKAWIRFSSRQEQDDSKGDAQAMAIKLLGVKGEKILEKDAETQDFIMVNHPVFLVKNVQDYVELFNKEEALTAGTGCPFKSFLTGFSPIPINYFFPSLNPSTWRLHQASTILSQLWKKLFKKPTTPLEVQYWSMTPYRLGLETGEQPWQAIKFFVKPSPKNKLGRSVNRSKNYLREAMAQYLGNQEAYFDFYIQLQTDPYKMPIEDPTIEWKGAQEYKVATIRIPAQVFDSPEQMEFGENLSYSPWHCLPEHRPLGGINRTRKEVYQHTASLRHKLNGLDPLQQEPKEESFQPHLLDYQLSQNALTVLIPIKSGEAEHLRELLKGVSKDLKKNIKQHSSSTHFARWVVLEDPEASSEDDKNAIEPKLLFTSNYDGDFKSYMRELVELEKKGSIMEKIWEKCEGYLPGTSLDVTRFTDFISKYSEKPQAFYVAHRGRTVNMILKSQKVYKKVNKLLDKKDFKSYIEIISQLFFIKQVDSQHSSGFLPRIKWLFRAFEYLIFLLIGIKPWVRKTSYQVPLNSLQEKRLNELKENEDTGSCKEFQNELTTFVEIKSNFFSKTILSFFLWLANQKFKNAPASLDGISTIHFIRWVIFDITTKMGQKKSYLYFESNYNGSWDSYINDFVSYARFAMNLVWGNCIDFPTGGCQDIEWFKQHIRKHQFPAQVFYSAYPEITVQNITTNFQLCDIVRHFLQQPNAKNFLSGSLSKTE